MRPLMRAAVAETKVRHGKAANGKIMMVGTTNKEMKIALGLIGITTAVQIPQGVLTRGY